MLPPCSRRRRSEDSETETELTELVERGAIIQVLQEEALIPDFPVLVHTLGVLPGDDPPA